VGALAAPRASTSWPRPQMASAFRSVAAGPLLLAVAVPLIFLHVRYQPDFGFTAGGTHVDITLSDLAVLAVTMAALTAAFRSGFAPLRHGVPVWLGGAALLVVVLVSLSYPGLRGEAYDWHARLVSALKFCEYAALALAAPLLVRGRTARLVLRALVAWSVVATTYGLLQYAGAVAEFEGKRPAQREPSLLGIHDFAALSGGALLVGAVALALRDRDLLGQWWTAAAVCFGGLGVVLSGAITAVIGMWIAIAVTALVAYHRRLLRPRIGALLAVVGAIVTLGTMGIRSSALRDFAAFLGIHRNVTPGAVESYAQRTVLSYIGLKIFLTQPVTGVGYQGSSDQWAYGPQLAAAHRRFPGQPHDAFPSPKHPWGVQNLYIETLADLGVIGFAALAALFAAALAVGWRGARASPVPLVGVAWLLVAAGVWIGIGIVPGIPLAALTWLGFGLATVHD
jgi:O-antigen ligase